MIEITIPRLMCAGRTLVTLGRGYLTTSGVRLSPAAVQALGTAGGAWLLCAPVPERTLVPIGLAGEPKVVELGTANAVSAHATSARYPAFRETGGEPNRARNPAVVCGTRVSDVWPRSWRGG
jgi:hypothetical protein